MSNKRNSCKDLELQLREKKERGQQSTLRVLTDEQVAYVTYVMHFPVKPFLYVITTKPITGTKDNYLLRQINGAFFNGKRKLYKKLSRRDIAVLVKRDVEFKPFKYTIMLTTEMEFEG